jgi:hypothetical protein
MKKASLLNRGEDFEVRYLFKTYKGICPWSSEKVEGVEFPRRTYPIYIYANSIFPKDGKEYGWFKLNKNRKMKIVSVAARYLESQMGSDTFDVVWE